MPVLSRTWPEQCHWKSRMPWMPPLAVGYLWDSCQVCSGCKRCYVVVFASLAAVLFWNDMHVRIYNSIPMSRLDAREVSNRSTVPGDVAWLAGAATISPPAPDPEPRKWQLPAPTESLLSAAPSPAAAIAHSEPRRRWSDGYLSRHCPEVSGKRGSPLADASITAAAAELAAARAAQMHVEVRPQTAWLADAPPTAPGAAQGPGHPATAALAVRQPIAHAEDGLQHREHEALGLSLPGNSARLTTAEVYGEHAEPIARNHACSSLDITEQLEDSQNQPMSPAGGGLDMQPNKGRRAPAAAQDLVEQVFLPDEHADVVPLRIRFGGSRSRTPTPTPRPLDDGEERGSGTDVVVNPAGCTDGAAGVVPTASVGGTHADPEPPASQADRGDGRLAPLSAQLGMEADLEPQPPTSIEQRDDVTGTFADAAVASKPVGDVRLLMPPSESVAAAVQQQNRLITIAQHSDSVQAVRMAEALPPPTPHAVRFDQSRPRHLPRSKTVWSAVQPASDQRFEPQNQRRPSYEQPAETLGSQPEAQPPTEFAAQPVAKSHPDIRFEAAATGPVAPPESPSPLASRGFLARLHFGGILRGRRWRRRSDGHMVDETILGARPRSDDGAAAAGCLYTPPRTPRRCLLKLSQHAQSGMQTGISGLGCLMSGHNEQLCAAQMLRMLLTTCLTTLRYCILAGLQTHTSLHAVFSSVSLHQQVAIW